jgi:hypothetical protein
MSVETAFVILWIGTKIAALILLIFLIAWGASNRQFKNMDRGRRVVLKDVEPSQESKGVQLNAPARTAPPQVTRGKS